MNESAATTSGASIPPDDPSRKLALVDPDDPALRHVAVVGDTYTHPITHIFFPLA